MKISNLIPFLSSTVKNTHFYSYYKYKMPWEIADALPDGNHYVYVAENVAFL
jgi:hypothetical protein